MLHLQFRKTLYGMINYMHVDTGGLSAWGLLTVIEFSSAYCRYFVSYVECEAVM